MFWKIYFWAYVVLALIGAYGYSSNYLTLFDVVGIFLTLFIGMGVYSYAFSKHFFNKQVWAILFYFLLAGLSVDVLIYLTDMDIFSNFFVSHYIIGISNWAVTSILLVPALIALWNLSQKMPSKKSKQK